MKILEFSNFQTLLTRYIFSLMISNNLLFQRIYNQMKQFLPLKKRTTSTSNHNPSLQEIKENIPTDKPIKPVVGLSETHQPFSIRNDCLRDHMTQFVDQRVIVLQNQLVDKELQLATLQSQCQQTSVFEARVNFLSNENNQLKSAGLAWDSIKRTLESKLVRLQEENDNLKEQVYEEQVAKAHIEDQLNQFYQEKNLVIQFKDSQQMELQTWRKREVELINELQKMQQEIKNQRALLDARTDELESAKNKVKQQQEIGEVELKLKLSQEHGQKLQQYLNEKMKQIELLEKQVTRLSSFEEDSRLLQNDLQNMSNAFSQVQQEHKNITKYQSANIEQLNEKIQSSRQQIEQLKYDNLSLVFLQKINFQQSEQIENKDKLFLKKEEEIGELTKKLSYCHLQSQNELNSIIQCSEKKAINFQQEVEELKQMLSSLKSEREAQVIKIREMSSEIMRLKDQEQIGFEEIRIKVETQIYQERMQERVYWEGQVWKCNENTQEVQQKFDILFESHRKLQQENDELKSSQTKMSGAQYQVVSLEAILKNQSSEIEKQKQILQSKNQENEQLKLALNSADGCQSYACELEKKVSYLKNENQRLNTVLMDRCKNSF